jgi:hypothetical protein
LFLEYISIIFITYLIQRRDSEEFAECEAVLLMEDCSSHMREADIALLRCARARVVRSAPHTTQIFQVLDVVLFGALKKTRYASHYA